MVKGFALVGLSIPAISVVMLPFAAVWAFIAIWLGKNYRRQAKRLRELGVT